MLQFCFLFSLALLLPLDDLGQMLDLYLRGVFGDVVRIYRSPEQLGLIKARAKGISLARGEVIVSLDSHVEVQEGW